MENLGSKFERKLLSHLWEFGHFGVGYECPNFPLPDNVITFHVQLILFELLAWM